jgi:apolipoprotein N-acyltransferase
MANAPASWSAAALRRFLRKATEGHVEPSIMSESQPNPIHWRTGALLALIAVVCFHAAYTPARSGVLALAIVGYVICLVQLARLRTTRQSFYTGLAVGLACIGPQLGFFWRIFGPGAIALWLVLALWIALFVALAHRALFHFGPKRAALLIPFLWTGLEYFRSELYYLKFSWLNAGYAFAEVPFLPWNLAGMFGLGFAAATVAACFLVLRREHLPRIRLVQAVLLMSVLAVAAAFLVPAPSLGFPKANCIVAGLQVEFPEGRQIVEGLDKIVAAQGQVNIRGARAGTNVDLIVLPEYTLDGEPPAALQQWCRDNQKFLIVGGKDPAPGNNFYDTAFVIGTNGDIVFKQVKSVPIQFFKDGLPASEQKLWESPWGKIGICICYDLSYTRVTDELVRQGAQMLIVPTMDITDWGEHQHELHARVAPVRAAEYGLPIFRVASSGISQGVTRSGWVQATAPFPGEGETLFFRARLGRVGPLPLDRWLAPFCVVVTGAEEQRFALS